MCNWYTQLERCVGAILIQKVSSKKQEASIEGSSVYKAEEDGGSVFWKRGNASIAGLSRRPTRVRQVFRRLPNEERERERDLLCKCPICTGCVVRPRFSYSEPCFPCFVPEFSFSILPF